jgi:hypothetical protein
MRIRAFLRESVAATRRATRKKGGTMWDWSWAGWGWMCLEAVLGDVVREKYWAKVR